MDMKTIPQHKEFSEWVGKCRHCCGGDLQELLQLQLPGTHRHPVVRKQSIPVQQLVCTCSFNHDIPKEEGKEEEREGERGRQRREEE